MIKVNGIPFPSARIERLKVADGRRRHTNDELGGFFRLVNRDGDTITTGYGFEITVSANG